MHIILLLRQAYLKYLDQLQTLITKLRLNIHLITEDFIDVKKELFKSINYVDVNISEQHILSLAKQIAKEYPIACVITFLERDIILSAKIAAYLNVPGIKEQHAKIARNKYEQRKFLKSHKLPIPKYIPISKEKALNTREFEALNYPLIIKPTNASLSYGVYLAEDEKEVIKYLEKIKNIQLNKEMHYDENVGEFYALAEEFLPGEEVTVDGVVLDGKFYLGGIHNKKRKLGPTFEEDLYSLPFKLPDREKEICSIAQNLMESLQLNTSLLNIELRQDRLGNFKVIEFSVRLSGAFCYKHIKQVYNIDLVLLYLKKLLRIDISCNEYKREQPTITTCTKWVFSIGEVLQNTVGDACLSKIYDDYFVLVGPEDVQKPTEGLNCIGRISVKAPFRDINDIISLEYQSIELCKELNIKLRPFKKEI